MVLSGNTRPAKRRLDYDLIASFVTPGSRVLDLGCGDGALMAQLAERQGCRVRGIEINEQAVGECIRRGLPVYHGDMLEGMGFFGEGAFDLVILSQTLQQTADPPRVIDEMLRVGRAAIISFPNFGYWRTRAQLFFGGHMPRHDLLPYEWYNTPNVHLCTVARLSRSVRPEGPEANAGSVSGAAGQAHRRRRGQLARRPGHLSGRAVAPSSRRPPVRRWSVL